jgi:hypothetical protein
MASIPSKHPRHETSDTFRPNKVPRSGGNGLNKDLAIVLDDSDSDDNSDLTLVDQKLVRNAESTEVCRVY